MTGDRERGRAAVLVAGHGTLEATDAPLHTLGQIGEALLATSPGWRARRLSLLDGERHAPDRAGLKHHIAELADHDAEVILLVIVGHVIAHGGEPALVTGPGYRANPDDETLPLRWICERLRRCAAERVALVMSAADPRARPAARVDPSWMDALGTARPRQLISIDPSGPRAAAAAALLHGLRGAAIDGETGTITLRSLGEHLARCVPGVVLQRASDLESIASSPPLVGPWDPRLTAAGTFAGAERPPADRVGAVLPGRFRLEAALAHGSFGTVYRARQLAVDREVAVKVLDRAVDPASDVGQLVVHEIQCVGRIDHPNVVRILQADVTADGCLFYAMELLDGLDLQELVERDGVMPRARAIEIVRQLLAGLAAAHDAGLVHADVKPANTVVTAARDELRVVLVDFGLARLRPPGAPARSAGGTPAYMAPEQLRDGRVDARSDLFSAALVLVTLLTGWRRQSSDQLAPPPGAIEDPWLRAVLARALAVAPDQRYQTAAELSAALGGAAVAAKTAAEVRAPFRHLAPFTEGDRLHGRAHDIDVLVEHVLFRRTIVYTAPSGTGKTSLLRAGLVPRLDGVGVRTVYVACRAGAEATLAAEIWPGAARIDEAVAAALAHHQRRLVIVLDQCEVLLARAEAGAALDALAALEAQAPDREVTVVLGVREDFLASLLDREPLRGALVVRLGPLTVVGAREAIVGPLTEQRIAIADDLLAVLLADLEAAVAAIAPGLKWTAAHAVYPPHLQLACSVLYESLAPGEAIVTLAHYRRLGGLDTIVGEYLERVLETELSDAATAIARELLLALVSPSDQTRVLRGEAALEDAVGARHGREGVVPVLEALRARGLVVRLRSPTGEPGWELVHDSLVPRVLAWLDRRDLARRGAIELLRHHLRRSQPGRPKLLGADDLREVRAHPGIVEELDAELARRGGASLTAKALVARSRRARRLRWSAILSAIAGLVASAMLGYKWLQHKMRLGRFHLELSAYDWDPRRHAPVPVSLDELPDLGWELYDPAEDDELALGARRIDAASKLEVASGAVRAWLVEAPGGRAQLRVVGRGRAGTRCGASVIPLRRLPGFASTDTPRLAVRVPTCQASGADMIQVPAGLFLSGGLGEPRPVFDEYLRGDDLPPERRVDEPAFSIDRTEVTNAAFRMFSADASATIISMPVYPNTVNLKDARGDAYPISDITWAEARAYCRLLGKELPTDRQWQKAMRGGIMIGAIRNPSPRRNLPWGAPVEPVPANLSDTGKGPTPVPMPAPVGSWPGDASPYGVLDLAGNVQEWTSSPIEGFIIARGCYWETCTAQNLATYMAIPNARVARFRSFALGFRCARGPDEPTAPASPAAPGR